MDYDFDDDDGDGDDEKVTLKKEIHVMGSSRKVAWLERNCRTNLWRWSVADYGGAGYYYVGNLSGLPTVQRRS